MGGLTLQLKQKDFVRQPHAETRSSQNGKSVISEIYRVSRVVFSLQVSKRRFLKHFSSSPFMIYDQSLSLHNGLSLYSVAKQTKANTKNKQDPLFASTDIVFIKRCFVF